MFRICTALMLITAFTLARPPGRSPARGLSKSKKTTTGQQASPHAKTSARSPALGHSAEFYRNWSLQVGLGHAEQIPLSFRLEDPTKPAKLAVEKKAGLYRFKVRRYFPDAQIQGTAVKDTTGGPVVELRLMVGGQSMDRTMAASDPRFHKLPAPIPLEYVRLASGRSIKDEKKYLQQLSTGQPTLLVRDLTAHTRPLALSIREGMKLTLDDATVQIERLVRNFVVDSKTGKISSRDDRLVNPAVSFVFKKDNYEVRSMLFSRYPDFSSNSTIGSKKFELHWPTPTAAMHRSKPMILIDRDEGPLDVLFMDGAQVRTAKLTVGQTHSIAGPHVTMKLVQRLAHGRVAVTARNQSDRLKNPAVEVELSTTNGDFARTMWITARRPVRYAMPTGMVQMRLGVRKVH